jgi:hypothetical protein
MNRFVCLMVAALATAAAPADVKSRTLAQPHGPVEILVGGAAQRRYLHSGRWYVEALKGREYAIRIRNPYGVRVAVALSVDGLNTIDARETTAAGARKWVLAPYQSVTISGWQTSRTEARRFEFTTEDKSYGEALGKTANLGTISAVFFRERIATAFSRDTDSRQERRRAREPQPAAPAPAQQAQADAAKRADEEYAATGMGRRTDHAVTQVWLDLEDSPAQTVNIRYEFRPQLVRLGILPAGRVPDPLDRRERGRGFEPGFAPVPPGLR